MFCSVEEVFTVYRFFLAKYYEECARLKGVYGHEARTRYDAHHRELLSGMLKMIEGMELCLNLSEPEKQEAHREAMKPSKE